MRKKSVTFKLLILSVGVVCILLITGYIAFRTAEHYVNISGQHLQSYRYISSGGMSGAFYSQTVKQYDDSHALITIENADWHNQDPVVTEYLTDLSILDELEQNIRKYHMNFWNRKTFSREMILDAASDGYRFGFDENAISFSSELYPRKYGVKLREFDKIIARYVKKAEKLPGLVSVRNTEDESYYFPENMVELYVYKASSNAIGIKILNGTDDELDLSEQYILICQETGNVLIESYFYHMIISPQSQDSIEIPLEERLNAGHYKIQIGEREIFFEMS